MAVKTGMEQASMTKILKLLGGGSTATLLGVVLLGLSGAFHVPAVSAEEQLSHGPSGYHQEVRQTETEESDKSPPTAVWLFVALGLGALAFGATGVTVSRRSR